jgi:hypothetical protein
MDCNMLMMGRTDSTSQSRSPNVRLPRADATIADVT